MRVNVKTYIKNYQEKFQQYKNVEELKIIDVAETSLNSEKNFRKEKRYVCQNQNGNLIEKSSFMLEYGYLKNDKGFYTPIDNVKVMAMAVSSKIEFSGSEGDLFKLVKGDYIVISNNRIMGMKKSDFEENYVITKNKKTRTKNTKKVEDEKTL